MTKISLVDNVLVLDKQSIHYRVKLTPSEALEFVSRADAYNFFSQEDLKKFVTHLNHLIPPMNFGTGGYPNPNNGHPHHVFLIGNEGSRVIYLEVVKSYMVKYSQNKWNEKDFLGLWSTIQIAAGKAHADEIDLIENSEHVFKCRFWWD